MEPGLYSLKMSANLSQYRETAGLFDSRNIVNRTKVDNVITSKYRNNTNVACPLISVNKILFFVTVHCLIFSQG